MVSASSWSLQGDDFIVKSGSKCGRLVHCRGSPPVARVGQPPFFSSGSSARSKTSLLESATTRQPVLDGDSKGPLGGKHGGSSGDVASVKSLHQEFPINLLSLEGPSLCQLLYNKPQVLSLFRARWDSPSFTLKPFPQSPKPGMGKI